MLPRAGCKMRGHRPGISVKEIEELLQGHAVCEVWGNGVREVVMLVMLVP